MKRTGISWLVAAALIAALAPLASLTPAAHAQGGVVWHAAYYNDPYQLSAPALIRTESELAFNWGGGSPAAGINADHFSAGFWADIAFEPGMYRFYILADDGVQLFAGQRATWGQPVIDTYNQPLVGLTLTADVDYSQGGVQKVVVNYREATGDAYLYVWWENLTTGAKFGREFGKPISSMGNWTAQYWAAPNFEGAPVVTQQETIPSHDWGEGAPVDGLPADNFSARWYTVRGLDPGTYTIAVQADDGVRVYLNRNPVINEWHAATGQTYSYTFSTPGGDHLFEVEYYEATLNAFLHFSLTQDAAQPGSAGASAQPPAITGAAATVTAYRLNVRSQPSTRTGAVITQVQRGQEFPIIGQNSDRDWWQIDLGGGVTGWVSRYYVTARDTQNVPVTFES